MHVTEEQLNNYITDKMPKTEQLKILEHISGCSFCAGKLASAMQKKELMFIPPGLKDSILEKTVYAASPSRKIMSAGIKKIRKEFWIYTAKVTFAASIAVMMVVIPVFPGKEDGSYKDRCFSLTKEISKENRKNSSAILDLFRDASVKISQNLSETLNLDNIK